MKNLLQNTSVQISVAILLFSISIPAFALSIETKNLNTSNNLQVFCTELADELVELGLENVEVFYDNNESVYIIYENRLFRSELTALGKVLSSASRCPSDMKKIVIIIKRLDLPVIALKTKTVDLQNFISAQVSANDFAQNIEFIAPNHFNEINKTRTSQKAVNPSFRKIDVVIQPAIDAQLGNREKPYKFKIRFDCGLTTLFARGFGFEARARIPVMDEITTYARESTRLYSASLNYLARLSPDVFIAAHAGYFSGERYGISTQAAHYFLKGNLALTARLDYTGFLFYFDKKWLYSGLNFWTYNVGASWQFSKYGFRTSVQYRKFLHGDRGVRISFGRYLQESRLDFFAVATTGDHWVGAELAIPLFPNKRMRPGRVRVNIPNLYHIQYDYLTTDSGKTFAIPIDLLEFRGDLTKNHIINYLSRINRKFQIPNLKFQ